MPEPVRGGGGDGVKEDVDDVVRRGVEARPPVVHPKSEDAERAVGLVRPGRRQRLSPKIVPP